MLRIGCNNCSPYVWNDHSDPNDFGFSFEKNTGFFFLRRIVRKLAETPVARLYLASSSAHPGGGVHGACGANAARAAINGRRVRRTTLAAAAALTMRGAGLPPRGGG